MLTLCQLWCQHECIHAHSPSPILSFSLQSVLGLGKKKKSPIGFERVVSTLANKRCRAPDDVGIYYHCVCVMSRYERRNL